MLLLFPDEIPADVRYLLARPGKGGQASARGPLVRMPVAAGQRPLAVLGEGDKLHLAARGSDADVAGHPPEELVALLESLGLPRDVRVKQIHLIVDDTGFTYAERFARALAAHGFRVREIKAPRGKVTWDEHGKVHVMVDGAWQPSNKTLNTYAGPEVQEKHRH